MPPSTIATRIATTGNVPGARPTQASAKVTMRRATPERSKIEPTSTNIGSASSGYLAMLACMFCGAASRPHHGESALAATIATMPPMPSATAIGTPASIRPTNRTTSSVAIIAVAAAQSGARCRPGQRQRSRQARQPAPAGAQRDRQAERRNRRREPPARHAQAHRGLAPADLVGDGGAEQHRQGDEEQRRRDGASRRSGAAGARAAVVEELDPDVAVAARRPTAAPASVMTTIRNTEISSVQANDSSVR